MVEWLGENLADHALNEFGSDYDPEWTGYEGPPLNGRIRARVTHVKSVPAVCGVQTCPALADPGQAFCAVHRRRQTKAMRLVSQRLHGEAARA